MTRINIRKNPVISSGPNCGADFLVENWRHKISANVGFDTASFDIKEDQSLLEDFFFSGITRQVTRYSDDGQTVIWDGYIAEMTLTEPGLSSRISAREMFNKVAVRYTPIDTSANPPTESAETVTAFVNDDDSQNSYGIKERIFTPPNLDKLTNADATQLSNTILQQYRQPKRSSNFSSGADTPRITCTCEGYFKTLDWRIYNQSVSSGTANANTIIQTAASSVGQYIAGFNLDTNTTAVQQYFNDSLTAMTIVQQIAALGDGSYNRWIVNVLEDRYLSYKQAASTISYWRRMADPRQEIFDAQGRSIPYHEIRPDRWLRTTDIMPMSVTPTKLVDDLQAMYIESVDYAEPDSLNLNGILGDRLQIMIARAANRGDALL